jgi:hypothetical protein
MRMKKYRLSPLELAALLLVVAMVGGAAVYRTYRAPFPGTVYPESALRIRSVLEAQAAYQDSVRAAGMGTARDTL